MNISAFLNKYKLTQQIVVAFVLAAIWVGAGRILFGVFGWMAFITLFAFAPIILMYGAILAIVVGIRQRTYKFRKSGPFINWLKTTLIALFVLGLSIPDAGDTRDSGGSALTVLLGDKTDPGLIAFSGTVVVLSILVTAIAAVMTFVWAFFERSKSVKNTPAVDALKESR